uniref:Major facilitator superfamily (MFS) profile domain-containing protein n=1 Tax=Bionectria ochroleuca TaxID=29856 RepID=A0A0B7KPJ7_BIOOC
MEFAPNNAEETCLKNHQRLAIKDGHDQHTEGMGMKGPAFNHHYYQSTNEINSDSTDSPEPAASTSCDEPSYPEGGLQGWLVVFGSFCAMGAVFGLINTSAVFESYFKEHQLKEYSHSQIGWIFSLYLFLVFFIGIQVGPIFDHYGPRLLVAVGSILIVASLMLLSISEEYYQIILTYSVLGGTGGALLNCPAYGAIAHFFNVRRGLATGIATTAGGIGGIVFPLLLQFLLGENGVGFAWSCRILGFILLVLCAAANLFVRSRLSAPVNDDEKKKSRGHSVWPDLTILRSRGFASSAVGIFFMEWGLFVPITYIISYAKSHGSSDAESSVLLASLNAGSVLGRFLPGFLADKLGRFNVIIATIALCVITILGGSNLGLIPVCIGQFCDSRDYGRYVTTANMIASFGTLTSVPIGGALLGFGGKAGWIGLILFSAAAYVVALACYVTARVSATGWKLRKRF